MLTRGVIIVTTFVFFFVLLEKIPRPLSERHDRLLWQTLVGSLLLFFWLPSPDLAIERVARRVQQGGHDIPTPVIRRRYRSGLVNLLRLYWPKETPPSILDGTWQPPPIQKVP